MPDDSLACLGILNYWLLLTPIIRETGTRPLRSDSKRVKLDGFGSFKIGITSKGARSAKAFTTSDNITGMHIVFTPERSTDAAGNRVKQFLQGAKCEELPENKVEKEVQAEP